MSTSGWLSTSSSSSSLRGGESGRKRRERAQSHNPRLQQHADLLDHDCSDGFPLKDTDLQSSHNARQLTTTTPPPVDPDPLLRFYNNNANRHHRHRRKSASPRAYTSATPSQANTDTNTDTTTTTTSSSGHSTPERAKGKSERDAANKGKSESDENAKATGGQDDGTVVLVRKIGQGSCGAVYLGRHPQTHRDYAIKLIPKDESDQRTVRLLQRVRLEGELLLTLDHPHIVRGFGVMETDDHAFLFMEHAQGGDLLEFLNREGAQSETRARLMFRQVVRAVRHLHQQGWVHRDIKPENIFIAFEEEEEREEAVEVGSESGAHESVNAGHARRSRRLPRDGGNNAEMTGGSSRSCAGGGSSPRRKRKVRLVLGDMGFARQWAPTRTMQECVGTFPYAAPEVINRERYTGPEVDVWSLGAVLLAMLTAQMPFGAQTEERSRALAAAGQFCVPPGISDAALDLLASILQPDPTLRLTLDQLWRHPWMRTAAAVLASSSSASFASSSSTRVDRGSTSRSATEEANQQQERRTSEKITKKNKKQQKKQQKSKQQQKKKKRGGKETDEEQTAVADNATIEAADNSKKRSRVHRAASLLFRRTTAVMGAAGKKRGRSTSAMASSSSSSSIISLSNDRVRTLATT